MGMGDVTSLIIILRRLIVTYTDVVDITLAERKTRNDVAVERGISKHQL
jgi:hypothetical protein